MIPSKFCKPRIFPANSARVPEQCDRIQDIGMDLTLNREKQHEIGRVGILAYKEGTPALAYSMRQFEFGDMALWYAMANKAGTPNYVSLDDFKTNTFDIAAFLTDDNDTFRGTIVLPKLRVNGFSINIGDPDAIVERNFDLVGEDKKLLDEKYYAYDSLAVIDADPIQTLTLDPIAVEYATGKFVSKVLRVRAGAVSELEEDATSTYDANTWRYSAGAVIVQTCENGDLIKVYYVSSTAYDTLWTDHNEPSYSNFLLADSCTILMKVGVGDAAKIYRLQSVGTDIAFERADYKEIGNSEIVLRGSKTETVTIALNKFAEDLTLERILAGGGTDVLIDPRDFVDTIQLRIEVYEDKTKETFKIGYLMTGLTPTTLGTTQAVEDYQVRTTNLEGANCKISHLIAQLAWL